MYKYKPHMNIVLLALESRMRNMNAMVIVRMPFLLRYLPKTSLEFVKEFSNDNFKMNTTQLIDLQALTEEPMANDPYLYDFLKCKKNSKQKIKMVGNGET